MVAWGPLVIVLVAASLGGTAVAAGIVGAPSESGYLWANHGTVFLAVGYVDWTNTFQPSPNGTHAFTDGLIAFAVDLSSAPQTLHVKVVEENHGVTNQSYALRPHQQIQINIPVAQDAHWRSIHVYFDGVEWSLSVATPYSLLPLNDLNIGGFDVVVVAIVYQTVALFAGMVALARWCQKRARWAPNFSLVVWGHVALFTGLCMLLADYQWVDQSFAGFSVFVYAFAIAPMLWLFMLSYFNRVSVRLYVQAVPRTHSNMGVRLYRMTVSTLVGGTFKDGTPMSGTKVLIIERLRGWWARLFGHYIILSRPSPNTPEDFVATVEKGRPMEVINAERLTRKSEDPIAEFGFLRSGAMLRVTEPKLCAHREVTVPEKVTRDGTLVKAHVVRKRCWPFYFPDQGEVQSATLGSATEAHVLAVLSEWGSSEEQAEMLASTETELVLVKSAVDQLANEKKRAALKTWYQVAEDVANEVTTERADAEIEDRPSERHRERAEDRDHGA